MKSAKIFFIGLSAIATGCSSFFSGEEPVPILQEDRLIAVYADRALLNIPYLTSSINGEPVKIYVVAFDGTGNDKFNIAKDERKTIVAAMAEVLEKKYDVNYVRGPGTTSKIDAAICFTCIPKAEKALSKLEKEVSPWLDSNPNGEIRILVLGFSRGAAIGRHFMNIVSDKWGESCAKKCKVRTVGVLFDTVATGQESNLRLGISESTDHLVHIISRDERRGLFKVVSDVDVDFIANQITSSFRQSERMTELILPGAHSDIGGSYNGGIGDAYHMLAEKIMVEMGVLEKNEWVLSDETFYRGVHDSRGLLDKWLNTKSHLEAPELKREILLKKSDKLSKKQLNDLRERIELLQSSKIHDNLPSKLMLTSWTSLEPTRFSFHRDGGNFISLSPWIENNSINFEVENGLRVLTYKITSREKMGSFSRIIVSDNVWNALQQSDMSILEIVIHRKSPSLSSSINLFVNQKIIEILAGRDL